MPSNVQKLSEVMQDQIFHICLFQTVRKDLTTQTGDPTRTGLGGDSIYKFLYSNQAYFFDDEIHSDLKHSKRGTIAMASAGTREKKFFSSFISRYVMISTPLMGSILFLERLQNNLTH